MTEAYLEHGVGVGVVVGQVAHVLVVFERDAEGGGVVGLAAHAAGRLRRPHKVVLVVADLGAGAHPVGPALDGLRHREHHRLHTCNNAIRLTCRKWVNVTSSGPVISGGQVKHREPQSLNIMFHVTMVTNQ